MPIKPRILKVTEIPDPAFMGYVIESPEKDVEASIKRRTRNILGVLAYHSPNSITLNLIELYCPRNKSDPQDRLKIFIAINGNDQSEIDSFISLIDGLLGKFYKFTSIDGKEFGIPWGSIKAGAVIPRKVFFSDPFISPEQNYAIPSTYIGFGKFEESAYSDFLSIDRSLDKITENVIIFTTLSPVDKKKIDTDIAKYRNALQVIRSASRLDDSFGALPSYLSGDQPRYSKNRSFSLKKEIDPVVDDVLRSHQRFQESFDKEGLLFFSSTIYSESEAVTNLIAPLVASNSIDGAYEIVRLKSPGLLLESIEKSRQFEPVVLPVTNQEKTGRFKNLFNSLESLKQVAPVDVISGFFRLPIGSWSPPYTIRQNTDPLPVSGENLLVVGEDLECPNKFVRMPKEQLVKHGLVIGSTGSGKSSFIINLLHDLFEKKCPFLVIETANKNYREIKTIKKEGMQNFANAIQVFSIGDKQVSPLRFNPLCRSPFESLSEKEEHLKSNFLASLPVGGPLSAFIHKGIKRGYKNFPEIDNPPQMHDLEEAIIQTVQEEGGYSKDLQLDLIAALKNRINSLSLGTCGEMVKTKKNHPSIPFLAETYSVIELDGLVEDIKCLVTLFILTELCVHFKNLPPVPGSPRFVIVIEEAHNVVGGDIRDAQLREDNPNIQAHTAKLIVAMMKELRVYGISVIIVDQNITAISEYVFRNSTTKVVFNQNEDVDRNYICRSILLPEFFTDELGRLKPGEAYFITESYYRARKIRTRNFLAEFPVDKNQAITDLSSVMKDQPWFKTVHESRVMEELNLFASVMSDYERDQSVLVANLTALLQRFALSDRPTDKTLNAFVGKANAIENQLHTTFDRLVCNGFNRYYTGLVDYNLVDILEIRDLKADLASRYERLKDDFREILNRVVGFKGACLRLLDRKGESDA